jgi:hypothetical protein
MLQNIKNILQDGFVEKQSNETELSMYLQS